MSDRIRTVIVDDEPMSLTTLRIHAARDADLEVIAECSDGAEAVEAILSLKPELVLLDIQIPILDGFEVLSRIEIDQPPVIVFITAHNEHAVRAFEVAAVDYLLKPFDAARFDLALSRAKDEVYRDRAEGSAADSEPGLAAPLPSARGVRGTYVERLLIKENRHLFLLPTSSIQWIEAAGNYLKVYTRERTYILRMKISDMERDLDPRIFARVHRGRIVNTYRIASLKPLVNRNFLITLKDGTEIRMSRNFSQNVLGLGISAGSGAEDE
jgi:two-component system, LytTR family, response regulator